MNRKGCFNWMFGESTSFKCMFGEAPIFHVKVCNHPIEPTIKQWLFGVPGALICLLIM